MKTHFSPVASRHPFIRILTLSLMLFCLANDTHAGGTMGIDSGRVIDNSGNPLLTPAKAASLVREKVGYLRIEFRLIGTNTAWNDTMLGYYDTVVNNARAAGLQIIGLIDNTSWLGTQSEWNTNNYECQNGNGLNNYINNYAGQAVVPIVKHFHDRVQLFELWNRPNYWTTHKDCTYTGGTYLYPSCFSQLLANSYANLEYKGLKQFVTIISGGVAGHSTGGIYSFQNAGAQYLKDTYNTGINHVGSFSYTRKRWGTYPLDAVGQQIYIDQGGPTSSNQFLQYINWVHDASTSFEGTAVTRKTIITGFGWNTSTIPAPLQNTNLNIALSVIQTNPHLVSLAVLNNSPDSETNNNEPLPGKSVSKQAYPNY
ncbi:hypothetical protein [Pedosphaera parvula]|uniref:Glycoside hydrolase family 5 domain-containing protein n=1 Tax=Pedosphaera parvula (strain Ellin514) TaxID=320771 RepID=B9XH54_PEDPL|nr:hypothetical protein [Pedosphaera parvula]EEF60689.1 hypothetical protein Cflav_PD3547 [Pedosphaera parvula Ellin514]